MIFLLLAAATAAGVLLYYCKVYATFGKYGVKHLRPLPLVGNMGKVLLRIDHITDLIEKLYISFPNERFVGRFDFINGLVVVQDLELVKKIAIKDFEHFLDHRTLVDEATEPLFGRNLFSLKGLEWKDMRSTLSPAFTSSKIRLMVPFIEEVGEQMLKSLKIKMQGFNVDYIDVECKDLTTRFANDVIASCAFGLKVDSHNEVDNNFYARGKEASSITIRQVLLIFFFISFPKAMSKFKLALFSKETKLFFKDLVLGTMKDREERRVIRPDMIHLLMEAKKGNLAYERHASEDADASFAAVEESAIGKKVVKRSWTDNDLIAQATLFFLAGFETVSAAMSFLLHELALNIEVQERLAQEIRDTDGRTGGMLDYNTIQNLPYLDMVISEVLRLWTPMIALDRICIKDYNMGKPNSEAKDDFIVRKGTGMVIPVWSFHRDPQYFPDPLKFDPERFSEENKHNIKPFSYMPFGLGPRNCIGSRFALCEMKIMAYQLLRQMKMSPCEKTCIPTKLATDTFTPVIRGGHWLRFRVRK